MQTDESGRWVTINGSRVFIKDGQSASEAFAVRSIPHTTDIAPHKFNERLQKAKAGLPEEKAWRVDSTHTDEEYAHDKLFAVGNGSTVAVTPDGDIISVCRADGDIVRGSQLLQLAVQNGGVKLDAFGPELYRFYTKNGFEPVSWTPFNKDYAPPGWVEGRDNYEPVIFYRYTGNMTADSYERFLMKREPCTGDNGYDEAKAIRDKQIAGG